MPNFFNPYYQNYYPNYFQNGNSQPMQQQAQPTIQHGGFVNVQSEKEALDYPIANGTSITFIDGGHMKMYVKTKGFSSLDQPTIKRYNIIEDADVNVVSETTSTAPEYVQKTEFNALKSVVEEIRNEVNGNEQHNADDIATQK